MFSGGIDKQLWAVMGYRKRHNHYYCHPYNQKTSNDVTCHKIYWRVALKKCEFAKVLSHTYGICNVTKQILYEGKKVRLLLYTEAVSCRCYCNFVKKETLAQLFSCEFCEIFKKKFLHRPPLVDGSINKERQKNCEQIQSEIYLVWKSK